jgi:hypothetical protein
MTNIEIKPINWLIAELLGWRSDSLADSRDNPRPMIWYAPGELAFRWEAPDYSHDMNAAMLVVAALRRRGYEFALIADDRNDPVDFAARFARADGNIGEDAYRLGERHANPAMAICLAALDAVRND